MMACGSRVTDALGYVRWHLRDDLHEITQRSDHTIHTRRHDGSGERHGSTIYRRARGTLAAFFLALARM
jgi:hypothetical protein